MKKVAIWAPLRYANIGDDMQAIAFAIYIKQLGYSVKLFQLDEDLALLYNLESSPSVEKLCEDVNLVVIAGGALLTPFVWYKRLLSKQAREYENDFKDLYKISQKNPNLRFCAISMGGDGEIKNPSKWYSHWRIDFFRSSAFIDGTVRLKGDVLQMKSAFGKEFIYHADMLFRTADYFNPEMLTPTNKIRVCLQFKKRYVDDCMLKSIFEYANSHDDMEFHFITTHMSKVHLKYQYLPESESKNIFIDPYKTPEQLLGVLSSCDIIVTSMLHVGLMGLTMGTPFLSFRGPGKTKSFLNSIGGEWAIVDDNINFEELRENFFLHKKEDLYNRYNVLSLNKLKEDSLNQYIFCKNIIEKFA